MSQADIQYNAIVEKILNEGYSDKGQNVRTKYVDGTPAYTKSLIGIQFRFDGKEVPILTTKKVAWKTAIKEMLLFWVHQTVKKKDFHKWNVRIWDEWFLEDETLGKSYAYQFESRPKKDVVKVQKKRKEKHKPNLEDIKIGERLEPNYNNKSKYIGKIYKTKDYGEYIVLDVYSNEKGSRNRRALIQFLNTNYIKEIDIAGVIKGNNIVDNYHRYYFGVGYLGDVDSVKYYDNKTKERLYRKWYYMLKRCYDKKDPQYHLYGGKGVFVDERWYSFENYLRDIRWIPQFFLAKEDDFKGWSIDKDYYCANYYGIDSAVWLKDGENLIIRNSYNPFYLIKPNGEKELYLTLADAEKDYSLSNLNKVYNGEYKQKRGFKVEPIKVSDDDLYVYRYKLSSNQVIDLIRNIKQNPSSRRLMTSFWNYKDADNKALQECAFQTQWFVQDNKLHLILTQRSGDTGLGIPFNQFQYFVLQNMIAHVCGLEVGEFIHNIGSCHIYDRHEEALKHQIQQNQYPSPKLWINPDIKDFFDFTIEDIKLIDYQCGNEIKMEVAI